VAKLSSRYATALFDLSLEHNVLEESLSQASLLCDTLKDKDCQSIITHPRISAAHKKNFFDAAFSGHISNDLMGFLHLAVSKNREKIIIPVLNDFIDMANNHIRKTTATVVSAVPLREEQVSALANLLSRKLNKQVDIVQRVDPSVIGGIYINVDGYYIDKTISSRLRGIKESMA